MLCLPQSVSEAKKKSGEVRRQWEEEQEEMKAAHEAELTSLRDKMRRQKNAASSSAADQVPSP